MTRLPPRLRMALWIAAIATLTGAVLGHLLQRAHVRDLRALLTQEALVRASMLAPQLAAAPEHSDSARPFELLRSHGFSDGWRVSIRDSDGRLLTPEAIERDTPHAKPASEEFRSAPVHVLGTDGRSYSMSLDNLDQLAMSAGRESRRVLLPLILASVGLVLVVSYAVVDLAVRSIGARNTFNQQSWSSFAGPNAPTSTVGAEVSAAHREMALARKRLEAGFDAQERFVSNVAHELKSPIASVLIEIQMLGLQSSSPNVQRVLKNTMSELEQLACTVDSCLLLARMRHGAPRIVRHRCLLRDLLVDSYAACFALAAEHNARIALTLPTGDDADVAVTGDHGLLRIVIDNLLRNAIRFSPSGSIIQLRGAVQGSRACIFVRDQGPGIPPDMVPRVFHRYVQGPDESQRGRGHGLGLAIALGIVELHEGSLTVRHPEEGGCEFEVMLPAVESAPAPVT